MVTNADERTDNESFKFGGTQPGNIFIKTLDQGGVIGGVEYDSIFLTYVASGNGAGEIETVTYKAGGSTGTTIAVLNLAYDSNNKLSSVIKA